MALRWPQPDTKQQRLLHAVLLIFGEAAIFAWGAIPAVADWYGSTGSAFPNASTGQTALIKGIYAVGYGTPQQAIWFRDLPIGVFPIIVLVGWAGKSSGYEQARKASGRRLIPNAFFWVIWIALLLGGGHWIALFVTGSWAFPDHRPM